MMVYRFLFILIVAFPAHAESVSIMAFNVENLFDNTHDEGKNDETYLPLAKKTSQQHIDKCNEVKVQRWRDQCLYWDWNDKVLATKLQMIGDSIKQINNGSGPDIVALQEIENIHILERLRTEHLAGLGYESILLEGKDRRGIDVAFLSKFKVVDAKLHEIRFPDGLKQRVGDTRPILAATFELPSGERMTGYSIHFPAPYHPTEMRVSAYETLNILLSQLPESQMVFAAGDFNTTSAEDERENMLDRFVRPDWQIAHDLCKECLGTSYFPPRDDWSFLDMVIWRPSADWTMHSSFLANKLAEQVTTELKDEGAPRRFRLPAATGVSDHWPLVMVIERQQQ
jgi:endonuclease/exonuclease/phosphatase family metal-dependent hydrolase